MMRMHSFSGTTSREVLQKVKQALGDDALILSNREVAGGIEVVALAAAEASLAASSRTRAAEPTRIAASAGISTEPEVRRSRATYVPQPTVVHSAESLEGILSEIQSLKSMLRHDIASLTGTEKWQRPASPWCGTRELLDIGFTPELAQRLGTATADEDTMASVAQRLQGMLKVARADEVVEEGGVYALVGPTGVGKTTTVAKLAARCVVRFGSSKVALLTTDGYRIGGYDQLRIYARILGVTVHAVRDADDLATALAELSGRHLVLIDTIGMSQRDRMVAEQAAMLAGAGDVKRLLLVQATTNTATLDEVVRAYKEHGVHGCIITKTDEAASLAPALDGVVRHGLPLHYVTDGQRVPEDLRLPDAEALVREALQATTDDENDFASRGVMQRGSDEQSAVVPHDVSPPALPKVLRPLGLHAQMRVVHG